jgi:hypothetical protein
VPEQRKRRVGGGETREWENIGQSGVHTTAVICYILQSRELVAAIALGPAALKVGMLSTDLAMHEYSTPALPAPPLFCESIRRIARITALLRFIPTACCKDSAR